MRRKAFVFLTMAGLVFTSLFGATVVDHSEERDFGYKAPGDTVGFTVKPWDGRGRVISGRVVVPGGLPWTGRLCTWEVTIPEGFSGSHNGRFGGRFVVDGVGPGRILTWKVDTKATVVMPLRVEITGPLNARHNETKNYEVKVFHGDVDVTSSSTIRWRLRRFGFQNGEPGDVDTLNLGEGNLRTIKFEIPYDGKPISAEFQRWRAFPQGIKVTAAYKNMTGSGERIVLLNKGNFASAVGIREPIGDPRVIYSGEVIGAHHATVARGTLGTVFSGQLQHSHQTSVTVSAAVTVAAEVKVGWKFLAQGKAAVSVTLGGNFTSSDTITNTFSWTQTQHPDHDVRIEILVQRQVIRQKYSLREAWTYDTGLNLLWDMGTANVSRDVSFANYRSRIIN